MVQELPAADDLVLEGERRDGADRFAEPRIHGRRRDRLRRRFDRAVVPDQQPERGRELRLRHEFRGRLTLSTEIVREGLPPAPGLCAMRAPEDIHARQERQQGNGRAARRGDGQGDRREAHRGHCADCRPNGETVYRARGGPDRPRGRPPDARGRDLPAGVVDQADRCDHRAGDGRRRASRARRQCHRPPAHFQPQWDGKPATIKVRHLLTHTSGLSYDPALLQEAGATGGWRADPSARGERPPHRADDAQIRAGDRVGIRRFDRCPRLRPRDDQREHLDEAIQRYVTGPLGMADTRFGVTDVSRLAVPYANRASGEPARMGDRLRASTPTAHRGPSSRRAASSIH